MNNVELSVGTGVCLRAGGKKYQSPSLNMVSKNLILTVKHRTKTPGPRHKANWNSVECCAD